MPYSTQIIYQACCIILALLPPPLYYRPARLLTSLISSHTRHTTPHTPHSHARHTTPRISDSPARHGNAMAYVPDVQVNTAPLSMPAVQQAEDVTVAMLAQVTQLERDALQDAGKFARFEPVWLQELVIMDGADSLMCRVLPCTIQAARARR